MRSPPSSASKPPRRFPLPSASKPPRRVPYQTVVSHHLPSPHLPPVPPCPLHHHRPAAPRRTALSCPLFLPSYTPSMVVTAALTMAMTARMMATRDPW
uniref:Uncharacterized protein n=1 Tax=Triticum urartu TaxID=4572 RepID=A0A8R7UVY8_TRIUA